MDCTSLLLKPADLSGFWYPPSELLNDAAPDETTHIASEADPASYAVAR